MTKKKRKAKKIAVSYKQIHSAQAQQRIEEAFRILFEETQRRRIMKV